ncbi:MAG: hypothetical protein P8Z80_07590 [Pseudolabrys sp.]
MIQKGTATGLVAGMRTSDISASLVKYTVSGSDSTCSIENSNSSPPKNIGNVVCLPVSKAQYKTSNRCGSLMNAGKGNCQSNSASGKCPSGTTPVYPTCNYRTSSSSSDAAYWVWNVGAASDGQYDVDCLQAGYRGYTSKSPRFETFDLPEGGPPPGTGCGRDFRGWRRAAIYFIGRASYRGATSLG